MSHFVSYKKQLKHITNHNKYTAKQDIIKKITYCCHEQNVQITIGNSNGETWIIETKGGFDKAGNSEDIDIFSPKKFEVLKAYLEKYGLNGGFVRFDKNSDELCICTDNYSDDITSDSWKLLDEVFF